MRTLVPPPALPSFVTPSVLIILPYAAVLLLSAYALISFHRRRLLEVRLDYSQAHCVQAIADRDRQILCLRTENGELRTQLLKLQLKLEKTAEGSSSGNGSESIQLEGGWAREKGELCKSYELTISQLKREIVQLKEKARTSENSVADLTRLYSKLQQQDALCKTKEIELQRCERDRETLATKVRGKDEQISELREKLSECLRRLRLGDPTGNVATTLGRMLFAPRSSGLEESDLDERQYSEEVHLDPSTPDEGLGEHPPIGEDDELPAVGDDKPPHLDDDYQVETCDYSDSC